MFPDFSYLSIQCSFKVLFLNLCLPTSCLQLKCYLLQEGSLGLLFFCRLHCNGLIQSPLHCRDKIAHLHDLKRKHLFWLTVSEIAIPGHLVLRWKQHDKSASGRNTAYCTAARKKERVGKQPERKGPGTTHTLQRHAYSDLIYSAA